MRASLRVGAGPGAPAAVGAWVTRFCAAAGVGPEIGARLLIVAEEAVTNVRNHNERSRPAIDLALERTGDAVELTIEDAGAPFDPTAAPEPDFTARLEAHTAGGLGIHLMRTLMDDVRYERTAASNRLTLRKGLAIASKP